MIFLTFGNHTVEPQASFLAAIERILRKNSPNAEELFLRINTAMRKAMATLF